MAATANPLARNSATCGSPLAWERLPVIHVPPWIQSTTGAWRYREIVG